MGRVSISAGARAMIAGLVMVADLAIFWVFASGSSVGTGSEAGAVLVVKLNALAGVLVALVIAILNLRGWSPERDSVAARGGRSLSVLSLVAAVKLVATTGALLAVGALTTAGGVQLMVVAVAECLVLLVLAVGTARHMAGAVPAGRR